MPGEEEVKKSEVGSPKSEVVSPKPEAEKPPPANRTKTTAN
ncbi:MAG: hypothetical protein JWR54_2847 [Mucilaginibacter sp.]|nr:hypothetical protein [Mucilaginibacter sp.]